MGIIFSAAFKKNNNYTGQTSIVYQAHLRMKWAVEVILYLHPEIINYVIKAGLAVLSKKFRILYNRGRLTDIINSKFRAIMMYTPIQ